QSSTTSSFSDLHKRWRQHSKAIRVGDSVGDVLLEEGGPELEGVGPDSAGQPELGPVQQQIDRSGHRPAENSRGIDKEDHIKITQRNSKQEITSRVQSCSL